MTVPARDAVRHYQQRLVQAKGAIREYEELQVRCEAAGRRCEQQLAAVSLELARAYLPELVPEALSRVERLTGFLGFKRRDPLRALTHQRQVLEKTRQRITADERYRDREQLAGPHGTLTTKVVEANEMVVPFRTECARFEDQLMFMELLEVGYDTPAFSEDWWQGSYWKHWAAGDAICKELGMDDFGDDVLPAYELAAKRRDFWEEEIRSLSSQIDAIHELCKQHDQTVAKLPELPQIVLGQSQQMLASHLLEADVQLLDEWLNKEGMEDRGVSMALRKLAGLRAKRSFLADLHDHAVEATLEELRSRQNKYARKSQKFARSKYVGRQIGEGELDWKFDEKVRKLADQQRKLTMLVDRLDEYDDYDRFGVDNDPSLWWYEFTRKQPPRQLKRLRSYYDQHPDARPQYDGTSEAIAEAVAEAAVASRDDDVGYIS